MARSLLVSATVLCMLALSVAPAAATPGSMLQETTTTAEEITTTTEEATSTTNDETSTTEEASTSASSMTTTTTGVPATTTTTAAPGTSTTAAPGTPTTTATPGTSTTTAAPGASTTTAAPGTSTAAPSNTNEETTTTAEETTTTAEETTSATEEPTTPAPTAGPVNKIFTVTFSDKNGCSYNQNTFIRDLANLVNQTVQNLKIDINAPDADGKVVFYFEGPNAGHYAEVFEKTLENAKAQDKALPYCIESWTAVDQTEQTEDKKKNVIIFAIIGVVVVLVIAIIVAVVVKSRSTQGTGQRDHSIQEMADSPSKRLLHEDHARQTV